jgi:tetratricopeptide (TPR) repeat protein
LTPSRQNDAFCRWLLRPYIDLELSHSAPLHAQCLEHGWRALADPNSERFHPQRAMAPGFRAQLANEARVPCGGRDPRDLPREYRTDRWNALCGLIDAWSSSTTESRIRLASLLHSMCFYATVVELCDRAPAEGDCVAPSAELAFWRASAAYLANVPQRISGYVAADLAAFQTIAATDRATARYRFNAAIKVFVHQAKTKAALPEIESSAARVQRAIEDATAEMDGFDAALHASRFYRAFAFLPQLRDDWAEVARLMECAELHAGMMRPDTPARTVIAKENWHALMESRTKEALAVGDLDLALERAQSVARVDPLDAKAWVELGHVHHLRMAWHEAAEAYAAAAILGPPAHAVGRHLAGICLRELGFVGLSGLSFKDAIERDPFGVSPRRAIEDLPHGAVFDAVKEWSTLQNL